VAYRSRQLALTIVCGRRLLLTGDTPHRGASSNADPDAYHGAVRDVPADWNLDAQSFTAANIDNALVAVRRWASVRDQDAVVIVPARGEGRLADVDFATWSDDEKQLWTHQIDDVLRRHAAQIVRNHAAHQKRLEALLSAQRREERSVKLKALADEFGALAGSLRIARQRGGKRPLGSTRLTPQQRGKRFEAWLGNLFEVYALDRTLDVVNPGEQIDFTFWMGALFVVGEARWRKEEVDPKQVRDFFEKLRERPAFTVGLLISISGFTEASLDVLRKRSGERVVLTLQGERLNDILAGTPEFPDWLIRTLRERLEHPNR